MPLFSTELMFGDVNMISIPTDAIFIVSLLIIFVLLGYFFNNIVSHETNQLAKRIDIDSNFELVKTQVENQLPVVKTTINRKKVVESKIKKLNLLSNSKLIGLGSLALVVMGGTSLLSLERIQKSSIDVNNSRANFKTVNESNRSQLSIIDLESSNRIQHNIKKTRSIDYFLSPTKSSKDYHYYQVQKKYIENNFSF